MLISLCSSRFFLPFCLVKPDTFIETSMPVVDYYRSKDKVVEVRPAFPLSRFPPSRLPPTSLLSVSLYRSLLTRYPLHVSPPSSLSALPFTRTQVDSVKPVSEVYDDIRTAVDRTFEKLGQQ